MRYYDQSTDDIVKYTISKWERGMRPRPQVEEPSLIWPAPGRFALIRRLYAAFKYTRAMHETGWLAYRLNLSSCYWNARYDVEERFRKENQQGYRFDNADLARLEDYLEQLRVEQTYPSPVSPAELIWRPIVEKPT